MSETTAVFTDDLFLEHDTGFGHPENARRLVAVRNKLEKQSYWSRLNKLKPRVATMEEIALIHDADYAFMVRDFCQKRGGYLDGDTVVSARSWDAAVLAAGVGIEAAARASARDIKRALLLVRPPGHHALVDRAMGFCLFNNIAICARSLQKLGHAKVAILDWDVHHGNGTEAVFYDDPDVLYISLHQYPFYPGTGAAADTGSGAGQGANLNLPMPAGSEEDDYKRAFERRVLPKLEEFAPAAVLVSAGFDAHHLDPLASIQLKTSSFAWMTEKIVKFTDEYCQGRLISFLEGGYNLEALADSVEAHLAALT